MTATTKVAPINEDDLELIDDRAKGPIANALELHNEAENAQARAEEAQRNAEQEEAEAKEAYEHKMKAVEELHFAEERYEEVHSEKMEAEEAKYNAVIRYEDEAKEAENAEKKAADAKQESERAQLRAFEASHAVKMQSEGEAAEAVVNAKLEQEEHFHAELEYKEKLFEAEKEALEAEQADEEAQKAAVFAEQQNQEAQIARAEVQVAGSHRDIQKAEAMKAQHKADMALREHEVAEAHHENVIASKQRNEEVWEDMLENDCVDDPMGLVVNDPAKNCDDVGSETHWSCDHFDEDFNGHAIFIWEICPVSCAMCGADRDQYYEEHHHKEDEKDDLPECLEDCPFEGLDIEDPVTACPWWHAEGPEHNTESCFNDCSPGVMFYVEHHVQKVCHGGPDNNPLECAMDCPIEDLDPHTAESFCPWFRGEKDNECFHDCSDKFLNMAQAHAEHTCYEFEVEGDKFINYISEPIVGADGEYSQSSIICEAGFYRSSMTEAKCTVCPAGMFSFSGAYECFACPSDLTSFPGASSPEDCYVRASLKTDESYDTPSYESEEKYQSEDKYQSEQKEWETTATVEPINYHNTPYPSAEYYNEHMPRASVNPSALTYNHEVMPQMSVDPNYNNQAYETEPEYYTQEPSYPVSAAVEKYDYSPEPEYASHETDESYDKPSYESEEKYQSEDKYQSEQKEWEAPATVEPIKYHNTPYPSAEYYNNDMPRASVNPSALTYNNEDMPKISVDPNYNNQAFGTEPENYTPEPSYPVSADVEKYDYSPEPEYALHKTDESYDKPSYESEEKYPSEDKYQSEQKEWETPATVEQINYHNTPYPSAEYYNENMPRASVNPSAVTYSHVDVPKISVDPNNNNQAYETEPEYSTPESSYPASAAVEKYDYSPEPEYNTYYPSATEQYETYDYPTEPEYNSYEPSATVQYEKWAYSPEPEYNSYEPSDASQYDQFSAESDYYNTVTPSFEDYSTGHTTDYSTSQPEFVDAEYDYSPEPEYNSYEPSDESQYDQFSAASDYYNTATPSVEDYSTEHATDYSTPQPEFVDAEYFAGQPQIVELKAPRTEENSPSTNMEGETELLSGSGH